MLINVKSNMMTNKLAKTVLKNVGIHSYACLVVPLMTVATAHQGTLGGILSVPWHSAGAVNIDGLLVNNALIDSSSAVYLE